MTRAAACTTIFSSPIEGSRWPDPRRAPAEYGFDVLGVVENRLEFLEHLGGEFDVLGADGRQQHRDPLANRVVDDLEGLAQSAAAVLGVERQGVVLALVLDPFAPPHLAADLHVLAGAPEREVVLHAVEAPR